MVVSQRCCGVGHEHASEGWSENYLKFKNLAFEVLLARCNTPGYPRRPGLERSNIQIECHLTPEGS